MPKQLPQVDDKFEHAWRPARLSVSSSQLFFSHSHEKRGGSLLCTLHVPACMHVCMCVCVHVCLCDRERNTQRWRWNPEPCICKASLSHELYSQPLFFPETATAFKILELQVCFTLIINLTGLLALSGCWFCEGISRRLSLEGKTCHECGGPMIWAE